MKHIGSVTGTATFERVEVSDREDGYEVTGHYGESQTVYGVPKGRLYIGGLPAELEPNTTLMLEAPEDGWAWAEATTEALYLSAEKPDE